ncbi:helicase-associated domain-containing protein [Candidatus Sumerlaeota bacterium]|nr:helicase-associated domain-containing protein [Candidatus Sumerlaeota bacterium]
MKLKSILKTLSIPHLRKIEKHWEISPVDVSPTLSAEEQQAALINNLYQRLQNRSLWEKATRALTPLETNLVNFLAIHGGDLEKSEVTERYFNGDARKMEETVRALADRGIVFFDEVPEVSTPLTLVGIPEPFLRYIELPSFWEGYLGNLLKELSNNELNHFATQGLLIQPENACKNYLIWLLRKHLLDPKFLRGYMDRLPVGSQGVMQLMLERKGVCVYRDLLELNVQRRYDHSRGDAIQWLLNTSGLLFTGVAGGNKYNNLLMLPRDVSYIIQNHFEADERTFHELDAVTVVAKENAPTVMIDNSNTLLRDLVVLCNMIDRHPMKVLATGGIGKNDLKKIIGSLSRFKTAKYAEFLSLFAIERKFLVSTGDAYRVSGSFLSWLEDSQAAYAELISWWLKTTDWNEEFIDGNTVHVEPTPAGLTSIVAFRRTVLECLNELPRDRWYNFSGFLEECLPRIEQEIPGRGEPIAYDKHTRSNELVVESIVGECLQWLGVLAIGVKTDNDFELIGTREGDGKLLKARGAGRGRPRKQPDVEFTFRFTDLGRYVFNHHPEHWAEMFRPHDDNVVMPLRFDVDQFIVQPTHEVIVPPDLKLRAFYHLNEIATTRSIDVMSILSITKDSVRDGLDGGLRFEEILDFLQKGSRTPIPDSLMHLLKDCAQKHGEVNMGYAGGYIVVDDEPLLEQIRQNKKISPAIKDVIDNRIVILNADVDVRRLARELQKLGFLPRLSSEHVHVKDDDAFHLSLTREDMYTLIAAVRYASECRDARGVSVTEERLMPLLERLKPDARTFLALNDLADPLYKTWMKAAESAAEAELEEVKKKYQSQITKIVSTAVPRALSKHNFDGPNPAEEQSDIERMLEFAVEHEFEVEIQYVKNNREEVSEVVAPESIERDRLLGRCRSRDNSFAAYKIDRIVKSKLI